MKYALLVGDKVYPLNGHEGELDKLAGEKVTVKERSTATLFPSTRLWLPSRTSAYFPSAP